MAFSFVYVLLFFVCDSCEIYPRSLASTSHLFPICICVEFSELSPLRPPDLAFLVMVALGGSGGGMRVERGGGGVWMCCNVGFMFCCRAGLFFSAGIGIFLYKSCVRRNRTFSFSVQYCVTCFHLRVVVRLRGNFIAIAQGS